VVLDHALAQLGVDAAAVLLVDHGSGTLVEADSRGLRRRLRRQELAEGAAGRAARDGRLVRLDGLDEAAPEAEPAAEVARAAGLSGYCAVPHPLAAREASRADVARRGLAARYGEEPVALVAADLARLAREGLARIAHAGRRDADETGFLDPVDEQLASHMSPGQLVAQRWEGEWARSMERLIGYARY
jgi:hypothetical protein